MARLALGVVLSICFALLASAPPAAAEWWDGCAQAVGVEPEDGPRPVNFGAGECRPLSDPDLTQCIPDKEDLPQLPELPDASPPPTGSVVDRVVELVGKVRDGL